MNLQAEMVISLETLISREMWKIQSFFWFKMCLFLWNFPLFLTSYKKRNVQITFAENPHMKIISLNKQKHLIQSWSNKAFKDTVVNLTYFLQWFGQFYVKPMSRLGGGKYASKIWIFIKKIFILKKWRTRSRQNYFWIYF